MAGGKKIWCKFIVQTMFLAEVLNEKYILQKLAAGDERAFSMLFRELRANIYTTALRMTQSAFIAEEVVQEVFLQLWKGRAKAGEIENIKAYLHGIAVHTIYNALKKQYREKEQMQANTRIILFHNDTENTITDRDYQTVLANAIKSLPPKQRETYILIKQQGLKREEAAQQLKVSPETVKWNLDQAMQRIRTYCVNRLNMSISIILLMCRLL